MVSENQEDYPNEEQKTAKREKLRANIQITQRTKLAKSVWDGPRQLVHGEIQKGQS